VFLCLSIEICISEDLCWCKNLVINEKQVLIVTLLIKEILLNIMNSALHSKQKIISVIL